MGRLNLDFGPRRLERETLLEQARTRAERAQRAYDGWKARALALEAQRTMEINRRLSVEADLDMLTARSQELRSELDAMKLRAESAERNSWRVTFLELAMKTLAEAPRGRAAQPGEFRLAAGGKFAAWVMSEIEAARSQGRPSTAFALPDRTDILAALSHADGYDPQKATREEAEQHEFNQTQKREIAEVIRDGAAP